MTKRAPVKTERKQRKMTAPARDPRPAPTASEQRAIDKAVGRLTRNLADPPKLDVRLEAGTLVVKSPHNNDVGWSAALVDTLGVSGGVVSDIIQNNLLNLRGASSPTTQAEADAAAVMMREGMAFVQALNPTNAQEAIMGVQMWATHCATMKLSRLFQRAEMLPQFTTYGHLLNKSQRTFAAQAETLQKLRTGGKQQVEVRYVYVDARTQTVVAGGGGEPGSLPQPHATLAHALGLPMRSEDPGGDSVSSPGDQGEEALPDARRQ